MQASRPEVRRCPGALIAHPAAPRRSSGAGREEAMDGRFLWTLQHSIGCLRCVQPVLWAISICYHNDLVTFPPCLITPMWASERASEASVSHTRSSWSERSYLYIIIIQLTITVRSAPNHTTIRRFPWIHHETIPGIFSTISKVCTFEISRKTWLFMGYYNNPWSTSSPWNCGAKQPMKSQWIFTGPWNVHEK